MILGLALIESLVIYSLLIAFLLYGRSAAARFVCGQRYQPGRDAPPRRKRRRPTDCFSRQNRLHPKLKLAL